MRGPRGPSVDHVWIMEIRGILMRREYKRIFHASVPHVVIFKRYMHYTTVSPTRNNKESNFEYECYPDYSAGFQSCIFTERDVEQNLYNVTIHSTFVYMNYTRVCVLENRASFLLSSATHDTSGVNDGGICQGNPAAYKTQRLHSKLE